MEPGGMPDTSPTPDGASGHHYGEGVATMKVIELNTERFVERLVDGIQELPVVAKTFSTHHVSRTGNLIAYDVRDRTR